MPIQRSNMQVPIAAILLWVVMCAPTAAQPQPADSAGSVSILEVSGTVRVAPERVRAAMYMALEPDDTLLLGEGAAVSLILPDGSLTRYQGPAIIAVRTVGSAKSAGFLTKLTAALRDIMLSRSTGRDEVVLGVRGEVAMRQPVRVPPLMFPPSGCTLIRPPALFQWRTIEGIRSYALSIFDERNLIWHQETIGDQIQLNRADTLFRLGGSYLWIVEARAGETTLRSEQAIFTLADASTVTELETMKQLVAESVTDPRLGYLLRAKWCVGHHLLVNAYSEVEEFLRAYPSDPAGVALKASLLERMGMIDDALAAYKELISDQPR